MRRATCAVRTRRGFARSAGVPAYAPTEIRVANVAGTSAGAAMAAALQERFGVVPVFATSAAAVRASVNGYINPAQLGIDRWLGICAAYAGHRAALCVVDAGTATTIDRRLRRRPASGWPDPSRDGPHADRTVCVALATWPGWPVRRERALPGEAARVWAGIPLRRYVSGPCRPRSAGPCLYGSARGQRRGWSGGSVPGDNGRGWTQPCARRSTEQPGLRDSPAGTSIAGPIWCSKGSLSTHRAYSEGG